MTVIRFVAIGLVSTLLNACLLTPTTPEALALQQEQNQITYNQDVKINDNHSSYDYRTLPERPAQADIEIESNQAPEAVVQCLKQQLHSKLGLPEEFIQARSYTNNAHTVALHNPLTHHDGVLIDVLQSGVNRSKIQLYANGTTLSRTWKNLPSQCK